MTTLSDRNTEEALSLSKDVAKSSLKVLYKMIIALMEQRANNNLKSIEKKDPSRIKTADIKRDNIEKFKFLASENKIKAYEIDDSYKVPTLKYDIEDEHKIVNVFKEIEEGYIIPESKLENFIVRNINKDKLVEILSNRFSSLNKETISKEFDNLRNYKEDEILEKPELEVEKSTLKEVIKKADTKMNKHLNKKDKSGKIKSNQREPNER